MGTQTFTITGTWQAPAGVTSVDVECWGGGGSGGAATGNPATGGGGAGGCYVKMLAVAVTPLTTYTVTVGTGGTATTTAGVAGNDSWFSTAATVIAKGGAGGGTGATNGSNGAGAAGSSTGCIGDAGSIFAGGNGGTGVVATPISGGGGGGAGSGGAGGNASVGTAGTGTATGGGNGGAGVAVANTRNAGSTRGGGGSGGYTDAAANRAGGDGGNGAVVLTWVDPAFDPGTQAFPFVAPNEAPLRAKKLSPSQFQHNRVVPLVAPAPVGIYVDATSGGTFSKWSMVNVSSVLVDMPSAALPTAIFVDASPGGTFGKWSLVYPSETEPLQPISAPSETVTLDKWWVAEPRLPQYKPRRLPQVFNVGIASDDIQTLDRWLGQFIRPIFRAKRAPQDFSALPLQSITTPPTPQVFIQADPGGTYQKWSLVYPSSAEPLSAITGAPDTSLFAWRPQQLWPIRRSIRIIRDQTVFLYPIITIPPSTDLAVWQNLATVTLNAVDLKSVTLKYEDLGVTPLLFENTALASLLTEDTEIVAIFREDLDTVTIFYEDTDIV